jgi:hypothetical protein
MKRIRITINRPKVEPGEIHVLKEALGAYLVSTKHAIHKVRAYYDKGTVITDAPTDLIEKFASRYELPLLLAAEETPKVRDPEVDNLEGRIEDLTERLIETTRAKNRLETQARKSSLGSTQDSMNLAAVVGFKSHHAPLFAAIKSMYNDSSALLGSAYLLTLMRTVGMPIEECMPEVIELRKQAAIKVEDLPEYQEVDPIYQEVLTLEQRISASPSLSKLINQGQLKEVKQRMADIISQHVEYTSRANDQLARLERDYARKKTDLTAAVEAFTEGGLKRIFYLQTQEHSESGSSTIITLPIELPVDYDPRGNKELEPYLDLERAVLEHVRGVLEKARAKYNHKATVSLEPNQGLVSLRLKLNRTVNNLKDISDEIYRNLYDSQKEAPFYDLGIRAEVIKLESTLSSH